MDGTVGLLEHTIKGKDFTGRRHRLPYISVIPLPLPPFPIHMFHTTQKKRSGVAVQHHLGASSAAI